MKMQVFKMKPRLAEAILVWGALLVLPIFLAFHILHLWKWDFSVPFAYGKPGADEVWQLVATKTLLDTGWVLENPFLGAPAISHWYNNSGSQTSALHSVLMLGLSAFIHNPVRVQQVYYIINFDLIAISSYVACRVLGANRIASVAVGLVYSFTSFRIHALFFAYLSNYFIIPLAVVPAVLTLSGRFAVSGGAGLGFWQALRRTFQNRLFIASLAIVIVAAVTDGYYAFFTLLLLGLATACRIFLGDIRRPLRLAAPIVLLGAMVVAAGALNLPLIEYRHHHPDEANQDLMKQVTDAEVYVPTLKLLVAPIVDHRLAEMRKLGQYLVDTANFNRKFPYAVGAPVVLGVFGVIWLLAALWLLIFEREPTEVLADSPAGRAERPPLRVSAPRSLSILALFILLSSVIGGLGSLIALLFPAIRAYERFPIFLVFVLWAIGALLVTRAMRNAATGGRILFGAATVAVACGAILDQTPYDPLGLTAQSNVAARQDRFLAERRFVRAMEADLPPGSMVYQYPYSQYLTNNKYYGWGSFGQMRLYLHSKAIRWSNGGAKGSPSENWEERVSALPIDRLLTVMEAAGFKGFVVDRLVYPDAEYALLKTKLESLIGPPTLEDAEAQLAFWKLPSLPYRINYTDDFKGVEKMVIDRPVDGSSVRLPLGIDRQALIKALAAYRRGYPEVIDRAHDPLVFPSQADADLGFGQRKVSTQTPLRGGVECSADTDGATLRVVNEGDYDWLLNSGEFPIRVAANVVGANDVALGDLSIPGDHIVEQHSSITLHEPWSFFREKFPQAAAGGTAKFAMLQDGNAWFRFPNERFCTIQIPPA
jgi:hypothetical protein